MTERTITIPASDLILLLDMAKAARNPRNDIDIAPYIGGSARANAARKAYDRLRRLVEHYPDDHRTRVEIGEEITTPYGDMEVVDIEVDHFEDNSAHIETRMVENDGDV